MNYKRMTYQRKAIPHKVCGCQDKDTAYICNTAERRGSSAEDGCVSYCINEGYPSLAMVYPARQCWRGIYDGFDGFERGTIFAELNKPFMGDKCKNGGRCK